MGFCVPLRGALTYLGDCGIVRGLEVTGTGIEGEVGIGGLSDGCWEG